jgi:hypothetical protein
MRGSGTECARVLHRVARRARWCWRARSFFPALASGVALLAACIEQGPLFANYFMDGPEYAGAAGGKGSDVPAFRGPEPPDPAPPIESEPVPTAGTAGAGEPPEADDCASLDADTLPPECAVRANEACLTCLSSECAEVIAACRATSGCAAISACAQSTGCIDDECYCGSVNPLRCAATGEGDGACRDVMLAAPGSREPSPITPNAGPASEAARPVGVCRRASVACRALCGI